jgi:DNA polymerase I
MNLFERPVLLFDATGLIFRAYYSIPTTLTAPDGTVTNAVHGVLGSIIKIEQEVDPTASAMIFDAGRRSFRTDMYENYKAQRPEPPDDLRPQFQLTIEMARILGVPTLVERGVEADDLIASCAMEAARMGHTVTILTSDRDLLQLLDTAGIQIWFPMRGAKNREFDKWTPERFVHEYGFKPILFTDYKALRGDPSDNIPGVQGIGEKTALKLVADFGGIEGIYDNIDSVKPERVRESLIREKDNVNMFRKLVTLKRDCEVAKTIDWNGDHHIKLDSDDFRSFADRLGLKRYIK